MLCGLLDVLGPRAGVVVQRLVMGWPMQQLAKIAVVVQAG